MRAGRQCRSCQRRRWCRCCRGTVHAVGPSLSRWRTRWRRCVRWRAAAMVPSRTRPRQCDGATAVVPAPGACLERV
jgi:hypothetical protein